MGAAGAQKTVSLIIIAWLRVTSKHIRRTILRLAGTVLGQIALVLLRTAGTARQLGSACLQVTALAGGARSVAVQHAGVRIAAAVLAVGGQAAVALLAGLHKAVAALWRVEEARRLVPQAVVHAARESNGQLIDAAAAPVHRYHSRAGGSHHTLLVRTVAIVGVMFHAEIVTHLMGHCRGHHGQHLTVLHADATGVLIRANGPLKRLAHNAASEGLLGQQLSIVVGMVHNQLCAAIVEEIAQRDISIAGELNLVRFIPNDDAHKRHKDVQWHIELELDGNGTILVDQLKQVHLFCATYGIYNVGQILTVLMHSLVILPKMLVHFVVHHNDQLHIAGIFVGIVWTTY